MRSPAKTCNHTTLTKGCSPCGNLKAKWDQRLTKDGLDDIEQPDGRLKKWHSFMFARHDLHLTNLPSREEYYRLATHFLQENEFESPLDKRIWTMHVAGVSVRDIAKKIAAVYKHAKKSTVNNKLRELAKEMLEKCRNQEI